MCDEFKNGNWASCAAAANWATAFVWLRLKRPNGSAVMAATFSKFEFIKSWLLIDDNDEEDDDREEVDKDGDDVVRDGELNKDELLFDWFLLFVLLLVNEDTGNEILLLWLLLFAILPFVILFEELTFCLLLLFAECL